VFKRTHPREDIEESVSEATATGDGWFDKRTQEFFSDIEFKRLASSSPMSYYYDGSVLYRRGYSRGQVEGWIHQEKFRKNLPGDENIDRRKYKPHHLIPTDFTTEVLPENIRFLYTKTDSELQELAQSEKSIFHEPTAGASAFYYDRDVQRKNVDKVELSYSFNKNKLQRATAELTDATKYLEREDGLKMTLEEFKQTFGYSELTERTTPDV